MRAALRRLAALAAAGLALAFAAPSAAKPPVWTVRSGAATITLFGSVHLLPPGLDWRPPDLDDALAGADEIWFELPITAATDNEAAAQSLVRGGLPKGRSLTSLLTEEEAKRLIAAGVALNCAPEALDRMQPWMADLTLSIAEDARGGASASDGVEGQIQALTPPTARRRAFETASEQIEFLAGAPLRDQVASLNWTVSEIQDDPASYQRVVDEWMDGDVAGLRRDALEPLERISPTLYARLIDARNRRWAATLANRLKKPGKIVVVVGVGHLVGPAGLPALLRADGFQVDGP
ncbi:MAG TPA: TraB/GumN family protein [Caulobacteraceae bacterium]|nr:TraB/GumN family protein [Caulobacteraceae bacterium]